MGAWRGGARPAGGGGVASVACARTLRGAALVLGAASTPGWGRRARADRRRGSASEGGTAGPPFPERGGGRVQRGRGAAAVQAPVRAPQPGDTGLCRAGAARRGGVSWTQGPASPSFSGEPCGRPDAAARRVPRWIHVCPRRIAALSLRAARGGSPGWISPPPPPPLPGRPAVAAASRLPAARGGSSGGSLLPPPPPRSTSRRGPLARRGPRDCVLRVRMQLTCAPVAPRISSRPGFLGCWMIWVASRHGGIFILHAWLKNPRPEGLNLVPCAARYDLGVESARRGLTRIWRILENCYHPESYMDVQDLVDGRTDGRKTDRMEAPPHPLDP
ncbi:collagen, type I, alpha 1a isoform X3 [Camelus dromedarius]|uniref:collagen, type I, alpha 1a isoform X3 n=1 Tax=Camelus dromedarius TaxID=9838 RepID=UPI003119805C